MKRTAKVFIWIGIVCQFFLIYPIIVGILALQKIEESRKKEDILTIGILTLLFCNLIGGIIMLTMTDKDLVQNRVIKSANGVSHVTYSPFSLLHKIMSLSILGVVLMSYIFSMIPLINFADAFIPFILNFVLIVASIILIIVAFSKKKNNKVFAFLSCCIIGLSIATITLSILHCCGFALIDGSPFDMPDLDILIGCIVCSGIILVMAGILFVTALKNKQNVIIEKEEVLESTTSYGIEAELEEVKSLFEKGLLNEEDYDLAKKEIIKKYYN